MSIAKGLGFGITSGVITTLGMIVALYFLSGSKVVILGAVISIAIADSVSDAFGIHISEESDREKGTRQVWIATLWTFLSKLCITSSFIIPIILLPLSTSVVVCVAWGYSLLSLISIKIAIERKESLILTLLEHLSAMTVVLITIFLTENLISKLQ